MARVSREQAAAHREAIADASARLFREHGLNGISVANLMADVGLTHGGFYGHFASKDDLATVACQRAFDDSAQRWQRRFDDWGPDADQFARYVAAYLSPEHRERIGQGCTAVALAGDIAREADGKPVREAFLLGLESMIARLMSVSGERSAQGDRDVALAQLATLVGALTLARAARGSALSDDILVAALRSLIGDSNV
jgi:TetR/AcrR family transcriptional repressor of nem operon